jgi:FixJ family two-component response regulator
VIFVIEPDEHDFHQLMPVLDRLGYKVSRFQRAEELLEKSDDEIAGHCIVSEITLPGIDGVGLINALKRRRLNAPVIILSRNPEISKVVEAFQANAVDYLVKPFVERELARKIAQLIPPAPPA